MGGGGSISRLEVLRQQRPMALAISSNLLCQACRIVLWECCWPAKGWKYQASWCALPSNGRHQVAVEMASPVQHSVSRLQTRSSSSPSIRASVFLATSPPWDRPARQHPPGPVDQKNGRMILGFVKHRVLRGQYISWMEVGTRTDLVGIPENGATQADEQDDCSGTCILRL